MKVPDRSRKIENKLLINAGFRVKEGTFVLKHSDWLNEPEEARQKHQCCAKEDGDISKPFNYGVIDLRKEEDIFSSPVI